MKVEVKLFGIFRDYSPGGSGEDSFFMVLEEGAKLQEIFTRLGIKEEEPKAIVRNHRAGRVDQVLEEGDVIAIFPPVAGGI